MKSLSKKKTNKAEWEKEFEKFELGRDETGQQCYFVDGKPIDEVVKDFIHSLLSSERQRLIDQIEKEVEFVSVDLVDEYDDYGKGWHDACLEYDLKLMKLDKKLSALRKEGEK